MRRAMITLIAISLVAPWSTTAQVSQPTGQKTLAATIGVYAFPQQGQDAAQQSKDESACYSWAVQNVGTDPFALQTQSAQQQQQTDQAMANAQDTGKGRGAQGAVRGAAAGALIGEIASDDAGKGAAYGAAAGLIRGRRTAKRDRHEAEERAEAQGQQAQQATAEQLQNFKKAFSVCLESKNYLVKF